jgi:hypothetical protein
VLDQAVEVRLKVSHTRVAVASLLSSVIGWLGCTGAVNGQPGQPASQPASHGAPPPPPFPGTLNSALLRAWRSM